MKTIAALFSIVLGTVFFTSAQASSVSPMVCSNVDQAMYWNTQAEVSYNMGDLKGAKKDLAKAEACMTAAAPHPLKAQERVQLNENLKTLAGVEKAGDEVISAMLFLIALMLFFLAIKPNQ